MKCQQVGGFTYDPRTGQLPNKGVAVALVGHSAVFSMSDWHSRFEFALVTFLTRVGELLASNGRVKLGGWYDRVQNRVYLDLVEVFPDRASAVAEGQSRGELAVFDLATQTEIRLVEGSAGQTRPPLFRPQHFVWNSHRRARLVSACCWEPAPDATPVAAAPPSLPESIGVDEALYAPRTRPPPRRVSSAFSCDFPAPRKPVEH